jgi:hypothetical protein
LDAPESLDKFKFRMGFCKKPMKQKFVFNPLISPFVTGFTHKCVQRISAAKPENDIFRKLDGIIRFHLEEV